MIRALFIEAHVNRMREMKKSAREGAARQRRREWRTAAWLAPVARIVPAAAVDPAAARWCACARSSSAWAAAERRRCRPLPRRRGDRPVPRRRGGSGGLLALGFRAALRLRLLGGRRRRRGGSLRVLLVDCCCARPCRDPSARPARGPARRRGTPACARPAASSWCRASRAGRSDRSCTSRQQPASAPESATRTAAAIRRCERRMVDLSVNLVSPRQLFATGGSKACSASARERRLGGVSPSLAIRSSHCRAAVASLARKADSASNSRAVWRKVASRRGSGLEPLHACWDRSCVSTKRRRRGSAPDPAPRRRCCDRRRYRRTSWRRPSDRGWRPRRRCATATACDSRTAPWPRDRRRPLPPRRACSASESSTARSKAAPASAAFLASRYW